MFQQYRKAKQADHSIQPMMAKNYTNSEMSENDNNMIQNRKWHDI